MFWKLLAAPRWIVGGSVGLIAFVGYGIGFKLSEGVSWTGALLIGALGGLTAAAATVLPLTWRRRELKTVGVDRLSPVWQKEAYRAALRGEVHRDPEIRAATLRIAEHRLNGASRQRKLLLGMAILVAISTVLNVIEGDVFGAVWGCLAVVSLGVVHRQIRTAHRRAADLVGSADELPGRSDVP